MNTKIYQLSKAFKTLPLNFLIKVTGQNIIYPFYHTVSDNEVIHIKHLYTPKSSKTFESDLDYFLKHYEPIDYHQLVDNIKNNKKIKKNSFLLSFDDGLSQFHNVIAPILKRKGIPAVCFLNSAFIDNKDLFFRYKASILIDTLQHAAISNGLEHEIKSWFKQKNLIYDNSSRSLLSINYLNRSKLDDLAKLINVDFFEYLQQHKPYLTTEQINSLINQGFVFGAHSIDHPQYFDLDEQQQLLQTETSIKEITNQFKLDYKTFSFPFTDFCVKNSFFDKIFQENNSIADLTFGCAGLKQDSCKKNIQRIPIEIEGFSAQEVLYGEYLYHILKSLINKNTIIRK